MSFQADNKEISVNDLPLPVNPSDFELKIPPSKAMQPLVTLPPVVVTDTAFLPWSEWRGLLPVKEDGTCVAPTFTRVN